MYTKKREWKHETKQILQHPKTWNIVATVTTGKNYSNGFSTDMAMGFLILFILLFGLMVGALIRDTSGLHTEMHSIVKMHISNAYVRGFVNGVCLVKML